MSYIKTVHEMIKSNHSERLIVFSHNHIFRMLGAFLTPLFMYLRFTPNSISWFGFILGILSLSVILSEISNYLKWGALIYLISVIIDYCDGTLARYNKNANFYGRFIDGFIDVTNGSLFLIGISIYLINMYQFSSLSYFLILFAIPSYIIGTLITDRYSSFSRWISEENKLKVNPTIKFYLPTKLIIRITDLKFLLLIGMIFEENFCFPYLILIIVYNIIVILFHIFYAKKFFNIKASSHRINQK